MTDQSLELTLAWPEPEASTPQAAPVSISSPGNTAGYKEWVDHAANIRAAAERFKGADQAKYDSIVAGANKLEAAVKADPKMATRRMRELAIKMDAASASGNEVEVAGALLEYDEHRLRHQDFLDGIRYKKQLAHSQGIPTNTTALDRLMPEAVFPMLHARGYDAVEMTKKSSPDWWKGKGFAEDDEEADVLSGLFTGAYKPHDSADAAAMHGVMQLAQDPRATSADVQRAKFAAKQDLYALDQLFPSFNAPADQNAPEGQQVAPKGRYTESERAQIVMDLGELRRANPGVQSDNVYSAYDKLLGYFSKSMEGDLEVERFEVMGQTKMVLGEILKGARTVADRQNMPSVLGRLGDVVAHMKPDMDSLAVAEGVRAYGNAYAPAIRALETARPDMEEGDRATMRDVFSKYAAHAAGLVDIQSPGIGEAVKAVNDLSRTNAALRSAMSLNDAPAVQRIVYQQKLQNRVLAGSRTPGADVANELVTNGVITEQDAPELAAIGDAVIAVDSDPSLEPMVRAMETSPVPGDVDKLAASAQRRGVDADKLKTQVQNAAIVMENYEEAAKATTVVGLPEGTEEPIRAALDQAVPAEFEADPETGLPTAQESEVSRSKRFDLVRKAEELNSSRPRISTPTFTTHWIKSEEFSLRDPRAAAKYDDIKDKEMATVDGVEVPLGVMFPTFAEFAEFKRMRQGVNGAPRNLKDYIPYAAAYHKGIRDRLWSQGYLRWGSDGKPFYNKNASAPADSTKPVKMVYDILGPDGKVMGQDTFDPSDNQSKSRFAAHHLWFTDDAQAGPLEFADSLLKAGETVELANSGRDRITRLTGLARQTGGRWYIDGDRDGVADTTLMGRAVATLTGDSYTAVAGDIAVRDKAAYSQAQRSAAMLTSTMRRQADKADAKTKAVWSASHSLISKAERFATVDGEFFPDKYAEYVNMFPQKFADARALVTSLGDPGAISLLNDLTPAADTE